MDRKEIEKWIDDYLKSDFFKDQFATQKVNILKAYCEGRNDDDVPAASRKKVLWVEQYFDGSWTKWIDAMVDDLEFAKICWAINKSGEYQFEDDELNDKEFYIVNLFDTLIKKSKEENKNIDDISLTIEEYDNNMTNLYKKYNLTIEEIDNNEYLTNSIFNFNQRQNKITEMVKKIDELIKRNHLNNIEYEIKNVKSPSIINLILEPTKENESLLEEYFGENYFYDDGKLKVGLDFEEACECDFLEIINERLEKAKNKQLNEYENIAKGQK